MTEQIKPQHEQKSLEAVGLRALTVGLMGLLALPFVGPLVVFPVTGAVCEVAGGVAGAYAMGLTSVAFFALPAAASFAWDAYQHRKKSS